MALSIIAKIYSIGFEPFISSISSKNSERFVVLFLLCLFKPTQVALLGSPMLVDLS